MHIERVLARPSVPPLIAWPALLSQLVTHLLTCSTSRGYVYH